jgi:hypothetical protein
MNGMCRSIRRTTIGFTLGIFFELGRDHTWKCCRRSDGIVVFFPRSGPAELIQTATLTASRLINYMLSGSRRLLSPRVYSVNLDLANRGSKEYIHIIIL